MNFPENCRTRQSIPCHVTGNRSFPDAQALPEFMARDAFFFQPILQFHEATIPIGKNLSTKRVPLRMIFRLRPRFRYDNLTFRLPGLSASHGNGWRVASPSAHLGSPSNNSDGEFNANSHQSPARRIFVSWGARPRISRGAPALSLTHCRKAPQELRFSCTG